MKRVLLTGIGGFVGAHCLEYFLAKTDWHILGIDSFRHKGTQSRINEVLDRIDLINPKYRDRVELFNHDLSVPIDNVLYNRLHSRNLKSNSRIDIIINMASDSAVERSVSDPTICWRNNCELAINMLEFARRSQPDLFVQFSTDEVYGECKDKPHQEWDVILPSNVYAASKAAQEALACAYWRSYNMPIIITNTMNIVGEWQDTEKFLPKLIYKFATGQKMEIYTDNEGNIGSRFYIHAKNTADALIFLSNRKPSIYSDGSHKPDRYNIVGDIELNNEEVASMIGRFMVSEGYIDEYTIMLTNPITGRPGYDKRYALEGNKMYKLGWKAPIDTEESIKNIVKWNMSHPWWIL